MEFLKFIYYLGALHLLVSEIGWLLSPVERTDRAKEFAILAKLNKGKKWADYSERYKEMLRNYIVFHFPVLIWIILGLFTFQWVLFFSFLIFQFVVIAPISRIVKYSVAYTALHWFNSLVGFLLAILLVVNAFHLKIDFTELLKTLLGF